MLAFVVVVVADPEAELGVVRLSPIGEEDVVVADTSVRASIAPRKGVRLLVAVAFDAGGAWAGFGTGLCEKGQSALLASHSPLA